MKRFYAFLTYVWRTLYQAHRATIFSDFLNSITVMVLAGTAAMVMFFLVNFEESLQASKKGISVLVYTHEKPSSQQLKTLSQLPEIEDIKVIPGETILQKEMGKEALRVFREAGVNIPQVISITLEPEKEVSEQFKKIVNHTFQPVYVDYGIEVRRSLGTVLRVIQALSFTTTVLFVVGIIIIVAGGVRSNILMQQQEIEVLKLVGATGRYIAFPYTLKYTYTTFLFITLGLYLFDVLVIGSGVFSSGGGGLLSVKSIPFRFYTYLVLAGTGAAAVSGYYTLRRML